MFGVILNCVGIALGALAGVTLSKQPSVATQSFLKVAIGVYTIWIGLSLTWRSLNGDLLHFFGQLLIVIVAMTLGRLVGRLIHLQKGLNYLGQFAKRKLATSQTNASDRLNHGFTISTVLFCAAPLAVLGATQDGLNRNYHPLLVKAVMDALAAMAFATTFGWGVMLSAIPVLAYEGSFALLAQLAAPWLVEHHLTDSVNAVSGLLIFSVALIVFELKKIELGDYLPSLVIAPLLTWLVM